MSTSTAPAPLVSIVMCTFNGARYLRESIDSCLAQTFSDLELIIVIDGSTDATREIVASYRDPRIQVVDEGHQGLPESLNKGFARARGRYYGYTSDDNAYLPDAIAVMVEYLEAHPRAPMVCTDFYVTNASGKIISYNDSSWTCFLYTADAARLAGRYRPEFWLVEDIDFFLRLEHAAGTIERIRKPYYLYRTHPRSLSVTQAREKQLRSLALHYELVVSGIERIDLRELFYDRMSQSALYRDQAGIEKMIEFAREKGVPFAEELASYGRFLGTPLGWWQNRLRVFARSRLGQLRSRLQLLRKRLAGGPRGRFPVHS